MAVVGDLLVSGGVQTPSDTLRSQLFDYEQVAEADCEYPLDFKIRRFRGTYLTITLNDGRAMPLLGLGTYKSTEKEAEKAIVTAAKYGYRLIDTASSYKNEDSIGRDPRAGFRGENFLLPQRCRNTAQRVGDIEGAFNRSSTVSVSTTLIFT